MKSILISIRPEWVAKILNKEKTIEVRKTAPKCELPITVYIYCTQGKYLFAPNGWNEHWWVQKYFGGEGKYNGKVVAKFTLRNVHKFDAEQVKNTFFKVRNSCLTNRELTDYAQGKDLYGWNISDLVIFDEPKELSEFYTLQCKPCNIKDVFGLEECHTICKSCKPLTKAPQSWCYLEEELELL